MNTATRLKERRIKLDLKPKEVAHVIRKSEQYISQLENGVNNPPTWPLLADIARLYRCSADWILGLTDEVESKPKRDLSADERSILAIMGALPEHKKEEVIRLAEVVLEIHRKEEKDESEPSLFDKIKGKYESNDNAPRIIGEDEDGSEGSK